MKMNYIERELFERLLDRTNQYKDPQPMVGSWPLTQPPTAATAPLQQYAEQPLQHPSVGNIIVAQQQYPRFTWYHTFVVAGLLLGFGASAAVFIKVKEMDMLLLHQRAVVKGNAQLESQKLKLFSP